MKKKQTKYKYLEFEKLVRDRNIDTIKNSSGEIYYDILSKDKKIFNLKKKLVEEAIEVDQSKNDKELVEELGDVIDVMKELIKTTKTKRYNIWKARRKKAKQRGKFKKGIFCHYVKFPKDFKEEWMIKYNDISNKFKDN